MNIFVLLEKKRRTIAHHIFRVSRLFTKKLRPKVEMAEKEVLVLKCETSHTVSTKWQFNGKDISGMDHREVVQEGKVHKLVIKEPTATDTGVYTCSVKDQKTTSNVVITRND